MEPPLASYYSPPIDNSITPPASPSAHDWTTEDSADGVFFGEPTSPWQRSNDTLEAKLSQNSSRDARRDTLVVRRDVGDGNEGLDSPSAGGVYTRSPLSALDSPLSRLHETPSSANKVDVLLSPLVPVSSTRHAQNASPAPSPFITTRIRSNLSPSVSTRTAPSPTSDALLASPSLRYSASPRPAPEQVILEEAVQLVESVQEVEEDAKEVEEAGEAVELVEVEEGSDDVGGAELDPVELLEEVEVLLHVESAEGEEEDETEEEELEADAGEAELEHVDSTEEEQVSIAAREELEDDFDGERDDEELEEEEESDDDGWEDELTAVQPSPLNDLEPSSDAEAASDTDLEHSVKLDQASVSDAEPATDVEEEEDVDANEEMEEDFRAGFSEQESIAEVSEMEEISDTDVESSESVADEEETFEEEGEEEEFAVPARKDASVDELRHEAAALHISPPETTIDIAAAPVLPLERADSLPPPPTLPNSPPSSSAFIQTPSTPVLSSSPAPSTSLTTPSLIDPPPLDLAPSPTTSAASSTPSAAERTLPPPTLAAPTAKRQLSKLTSKIAKGTRKPDIPSKIKRRSGLVAAPAPVKDEGTPVTNRPLQGRIPSTSGLPKRSTPPLKPSLAMRSAVPARPAVGGPPTTSSSIPSKIKASPLPSSLPSKLNRLPTSRPPISASGTSRGPAQTLLAQRKAAQEHPELPARPGSAASNSSASSLSTSTLRRPGVVSKPSNLKPPSTGTTAKGGIARPAPLVRRVVPGGVPAIRSGVASGSSAVRPPSSAVGAGASRPPSSTSSISRPASSAIPSSRPAPASLPSRQIPSQPLPRPSPARPSVHPTTRLLPPLGQTHSALSLLMPTDLRPALVLPTTDVVAIARVPSPLLPRPAPLAVIGNAATRNEGGSKSPLKRRALRAWEVPAETERASRAESENAPPRQTPGSTSASTALQRSVSTPALSSTVVVTLTRPTPPTTIVSPLKLKPLPTHAATPEAANDEQPSALTAPAEKLDAEAGVELFGAVVEPAPAMLPRPKRTRTPTVDVEADAGPSARSTRRTALNAQLASTTPLPRPTRRQPAPVVEEEPPPEEPEAPIERAPITFNPAPALTQEELSQLTQKNTKRNKMLFNKLDLQTIHMDTNRPPSPTSKIRRSLGSEGAAGRPTTKEGREARAAKRRTALRSSTDGTEVLLVDLELEEEGAKDGAAVLPLVHYRAPGDEEEYMSPVRPRKSKGKKRSLATSEGERRRVKWDRALVYEGPLEPQNEGEPDGILKKIPLDAFGNSTSTSTGFAKPACVAIRMRVYKDDE